MGDRRGLFARHGREHAQPTTVLRTRDRYIELALRLVMLGSDWSDTRKRDEDQWVLQALGFVHSDDGDDARIRLQPQDIRAVRISSRCIRQALVQPADQRMFAIEFGRGMLQEFT